MKQLEAADPVMKGPVVEKPIDDDERSKQATPLTSHQENLGETSPSSREAGQEAPSETCESPPMLPQNQGAVTLPSQAEPLPAPMDVDSMKLPVHDESVPYWERLAPLPVPNARPGTSSRRPQSKAGKIVVYETEKQKKLKAEAKKKRDADAASSPPAKADSLPPVTGARSALPPLKERKRKSKKAPDGAGDTLVLAPVKPVRDWKGSSGGEAWEVAVAEVSAAPAPEVLKFESPAKEGIEASQ